MQTMTVSIPEQGQLVRVRGQHYLVQDVFPYQANRQAPTIHRVSLECLDDDRLGDTLDVIREREVHKAVHEAIGLPTPVGRDPAPRFQAFLHAVEWSTSSVEGAGEQGETRKRGVERAAVGGRQASLPGLEDPSPWQLGVFEEEGE